MKKGDKIKKVSLDELVSEHYGSKVLESLKRLDIDKPGIALDLSGKRVRIKINISKKEAIAWLTALATILSIVFMWVVNHADGIKGLLG